MNLGTAGKFVATSVGMALVGFVVGSVAASTPAQAAVRSKAGASVARNATTNFNFNNIPVRSALQLIAEEGHFNLVVSDSVQGNISLRLNDVTWEQALDLVLKVKGLQQRVEGNAISVTSASG